MISAVVLAAGYSSRMGSFKPLLTVGEVPALERLIAGIKEAGIKNIAVVTGYRHELLQPVIRSMSGSRDGDRRGVQRWFRQRHVLVDKDGIARVREVFPDSEGCFLMPVDCPLIDSKVITTLEETVMCSGDTVRDSFAVPVFEGKKGHPLYVPAGYAERYAATTDREDSKVSPINTGTGCSGSGGFRGLYTGYGYSRRLQRDRGFPGGRMCQRKS